MLMLDATTSLRTGFSASASSSTAVARLFADVYSASSYIDCPTPTRAARWATTSTPSSARRSAATSRTSPTWSSTSSARYSGRVTPSCTCGVRLSKARTRWPRASSSSARCEPMKPAPPVIRTFSGVGFGDGALEPGRCTERIRLVRALPGEVVVVPAEMTVRRGLRIDRAPEVEVAEDRRGTQVEVLLHELLDPADGDRFRPERLDENGHRVCDADRVRDLDLAALGQPPRDDVLRDVARRVGGRAVDLRRVLARERAAAVRSSAAVCVDDDLPAGEPRVAHRPADHELAGRVAEEEVLRLEPPRVVQVFGQNRLEHVSSEVGLEERLDVDSLAVL